MLTFRVFEAPSPAVFDELCALAPRNPFQGAAYAEAMRKMGFEVCAFGLERRNKLVAGCLGLINAGRLQRALAITSLPALPDPDAFWLALLDYCDKRRISTLRIGTFASPHCVIPPFDGELERFDRCEFVIDLKQSDLLKAMSSNHVRNIRKGEKAGLTMVRTRERSACDEHARCTGDSIERRNERGEETPSRQGGDEFWTLLASGAGELFQASLEGKIVSSLLVLRAAKGAYYWSAGTTREGMDCGASQFLINEIIDTLQRESLEVFNLGGAPADSGLARFKAGFGATTIPLQKATFEVGSSVRIKLVRIARRTRKLIGSLSANG